MTNYILYYLRHGPMKQASLSLHFSDEKTKAQKIRSVLSTETYLESGRAGIRSQVSLPPAMFMTGTSIAVLGVSLNLRASLPHPHTVPTSSAQALLGLQVPGTLPPPLPHPLVWDCSLGFCSYEVWKGIRKSNLLMPFAKNKAEVAMPAPRF